MRRAPELDAMLSGDEAAVRDRGVRRNQLLGGAFLLLAGAVAAYFVMTAGQDRPRDMLDGDEEFTTTTFRPPSFVRDGEEPPPEAETPIIKLSEPPPPEPEPQSDTTQFDVPPPRSSSSPTPSLRRLRSRRSKNSRSATSRSRSSSIPPGVTTEVRLLVNPATG